ncbi:hypothetical protein DPMN_139099 [Dreissena polymorpha]|uniref:Uncharacterized protein n=1 Tax=Dreissena polymorpha TaxID=45954 RepID=A0A9D4G8I8_DREPO|nr:hypothetical protein DPMN_139099 [Dreissena polymorpha]
MDITHVIPFCSYVKNYGCYGNNKKYSDNGGISDNGGAGRGLYCLAIVLLVVTTEWYRENRYFSLITVHTYADLGIELENCYVNVDDDYNDDDKAECSTTHA